VTAPEQETTATATQVATRPGTNTANHGREQDVLIIGAGMAGLAAAHALTQAGVRVRVLEGRERLGGRIHTSQAWPDTPLDMGASWIHGPEGNPLTAVAAQANAQTIATSYDSAITYNSDGQPLSDEDEEEIESLSEALADLLAEAQDEDPDRPIQAIVDTAVAANALSAEERRWVDFILSSTLEHEYAGSAAELSTHWFDDGDEFDGQDVLFPEGYGQLTDFLARGVPVELGQVVRSIRWEEGRVVVESDTAVYEAEAAIITLPLGVLQAGTVTFSPALPRAKQQAIDSLGMGLLNKCYLRFPRQFWPRNVDWLQYIPERKGEWVEWVNFSAITDQPILLGFNAADFGRETESWTDEQIVASAMQTLRQIFGADIPDPEAYQLTRWASDPLAGGSYSFNALGSTPDMRDALAEPLADTLFWAGEATSRDYFGTVHGAYLSGVAAAEAVRER
ncbi:MAG: FAD-dependent oxidoreductase, partial [Anaerolineales bacterium]|nr:FAD-dependent oxidoreductase [Anaerolineales bacterium]